MKITGKTNIKNRFDIECKDIRTGEVQKFQAHNIVLDQMWSRLVNFQSFFEYIHFGTGDGSLSPTRTSLFSHLGTKTAGDVSSSRALPTSYRQRSIVLNPEEHVGQEITEVGVAYGSGSTNLVTHAFLEDSEGNPISIVKTDTMVVTIYATIFFELGNLEDMYSGRFRWVMPLANNELVSYFMGSTYPTQQFRVTQAFDFAPASHEGVAPTSHGRSSNILVADWSKDAANKRVTTPVRRLGISDGNGEIRGFGIGSSDTAGTFRGQFPITGVFAGWPIEGEQVGVGDGETVGFNPIWADADISAVYLNDVPVDPADYDLAPTRKGTNLFLFRGVQQLSGVATNSNLLTALGNEIVVNVGGRSFGVDVGAENAPLNVYRLRVHNIDSYGLTLIGTNNADYSGGETITTVSGSLDDPSEWVNIDFSATAYRYYKLSWSGGRVWQIQLLTAEDQIQFHTPPDEGAVITADYTVSYVPKDVNHVLDLQVTIQYGEET